MKYISDYKNQAWSLKLEKSSVRTISLCPLLGDHLFHLVHLPVVLLIHHHLNDNHHLPNGPTTYIVANMITAPLFPATLAPTELADPLGDPLTVFFTTALNTDIDIF